MVPPKRRKTPVTGIRTRSRPSSTKTRSVIHKFHVLTKSKRQLQGQPGNERELSAIDERINNLGGLDAYQRMSRHGQSSERGGGTEAVLIEWLRDMVNVHPLGESQRLRLLEVGALRADNYGGCRSWIDNTPIDLNAQDPGIKQQDFLKMSEDKNACKWDVLSLSLVLNFVPDPRERGRMLRLAHSFLDARCARSGLLFVTVGVIQASGVTMAFPGKFTTDSLVQLPLPCIQNSRYLTLSHFESLMKCVGFDKVKERWKVGGKMGYWLFRKVNPTGLGSLTYSRKFVLRSGKGRNNFSVLL